MPGSEALAEQAKKNGVDWWGLFFLCVGVGCFQYILERGEADQWFDSQLFAPARSSPYHRNHLLHLVGAQNQKSDHEPKALQVEHRSFGNEPHAHARDHAVRPHLCYSGLRINGDSRMSATQTGMLFMPGSIATAIFMLPVGNLLK